MTRAPRKARESRSRCNFFFLGGKRGRKHYDRTERVKIPTRSGEIFWALVLGFLWRKQMCDSGVNVGISVTGPPEKFLSREGRG